MFVQPLRLPKSLRLSKTHTRSSIQGINNSSDVGNHCVSVNMRSRHTDKHDSLKFAVLSDITCTKPATKLDTSSLRIPPDIKLADEYFNLPGDIDLLLGVDLYYEMLRSGGLSRPCFPVIQERVLGWNLSGTIAVHARVEICIYLFNFQLSFVCSVASSDAIFSLPAWHLTG